MSLDPPGQAAARDPGGRDRARGRRQRRSAPTCASSPRPTSTSSEEIRPAASARTSTTASTSSRSGCRRCASGRGSAGALASSCRYNARFHKSVMGVSDATLGVLRSYCWPGNVRELQNLVERLVATDERGFIAEEDLPLELQLSPQGQVAQQRRPLRRRGRRLRAQPDRPRRSRNATATCRRRAATWGFRPHTTLKHNIQRHGIRELAPPAAAPQAPMRLNQRLTWTGHRPWPVDLVCAAAGPPTRRIPNIRPTTTTSGACRCTTIGALRVPDPRRRPGRA